MAPYSHAELPLSPGFLNLTFTLNAYQPAFDAAHVWDRFVFTAFGSNEYYHVAVKDTVGGLSQVDYVQVDIEGPLGTAG
jgi:hypothetical protein